MRLDLALDMDHEMVRLAGVIPWDRLAEEFGPLYCADNGRPTEQTVIQQKAPSTKGPAWQHIGTKRSNSVCSHAWVYSMK